MTSSVAGSAKASSSLRTRRILLVGMMGAGKTTVGRLLAERLGRHYVDSDEEVEAATGRTVRELFEEGGERAFRPLESEALAAAVRGDTAVVVGVAGGAVLDPANRDLLKRSGTVVWLRATPETLARRILRPSDADPGSVGHSGNRVEHGSGGGSAQGSARGSAQGSAQGSARGAAAHGPGDGPDHRPLLAHDPQGVLRHLSVERRPLYEAVADVVVDVDDVDPAGVVDRVVAAIGAEAGR